MSPKPSRSAYAPLPRQSTDSGSSSTDSLSFPTGPSSQTPTRTPPSATALHVDLLFRRWTSEIAERIRRKKREGKTKKQKKKAGAVEERDRNKPVEIMASAFEVWEGAGKGKGRERVVRTLDHGELMSKEAFDGLAEEVRQGIEQGVQPRLNSKGSSGSYFARDASGTTLAIFKPKDEEPYGRLNPKLTKWIHRNFLARVIPFGRACLIPQLSYLSEAAASLMDRRLESHIVPRTDVVDLSSPAFFYDWIDRERAKISKAGKGRKLPEKPGSFQVFLKGFQDATVFLRDHPYPGRPLSQTLDTSAHRRKRINLLAPFACLCGRAEAEDDDEDGWGWGGEDDGVVREGKKEEGFKWTEEMMASFRLELEKLVVLDYVIRNTDRGLDNFMIKGCTCSSPEDAAASTSDDNTPHVHIAAIDNSLSFPHQHPLGWRSYTYGWLYLPVSLIGLPFSSATREHFLPLLTSPSWWAQTTFDLRQLFSIDPDFEEKMFMKQMAVMKGQAWNVVQSLKSETEGPIELCRRPKKLVWDDFVEVADDDLTRSLIAATASPPSPPPTLSSIPTPPPSPPPAPRVPLSPLTSTRPLPTVSQPPRAKSPAPISQPSMPLKRVSSDHPRRPRSQSSRPSFSGALSSSRVPAAEFGSLTGVSLMQHLDRVEAEERAFGIGEPPEGSEEDGESSSWGVRSENDVRYSTSSQDVEGKPTNWRERVRETLSFDIDRAAGGGAPNLGWLKGRNRSGSVGGVSRGGKGRGRGGHGRYTSVGIEEGNGSWLGEYGEGRVPEEEEEEEEEPRKKVVVVERLETVEEKPLFAWSACLA